MNSDVYKSQDIKEKVDYLVEHTTPQELVTVINSLVFALRHQSRKPYVEFLQKQGFTQEVIGTVENLTRQAVSLMFPKGGKNA